MDPPEQSSGGSIMYLPIELTKDLNSIYRILLYIFELCVGLGANTSSMVGFADHPSFVF